MARLFTTGAEAGTTAVFTTINSAAVSTAQKRTGAYSFFLDGAYWAAWTFPASITEFYMRFGVYFTTFANRAGFLAVYDSGGATQVSLEVNVVNGLIIANLSEHDLVLGTGTHPLSLNQWYCIEVYVKIANDATGRVTVKVDGASDIAYQGDTQNSGLTNARSIRLGCIHTNWYPILYVDDIAINDTAGAVNNSWIGRGGVYVDVVTAAGTYTDLHPSTGNAWDCINEVPPADGDYVYDGVVDQKSTYALSTITPTTGDIACINVILRANMASGAGNIARIIRSNGTDSQGSDVGLDATAKTIAEIIETDPSGGGAWTIARVNALEAGAVVR